MRILSGVFVFIAMSLGNYSVFGQVQQKQSDEMNRTVNFGYAFATPHRLTVSMPNSSDKTLVDVYPDNIRLKWTYENLLTQPVASFSTPGKYWILM